MKQGDGSSFHPEMEPSPCSISGWNEEPSPVSQKPHLRHGPGFGIIFLSDLHNTEGGVKPKVERAKASNNADNRLFTIKKYKEKKIEYYDYSLLAVIIILISFGLVMLYSTSGYLAEVQYSDDMYYFKRQGMFSIASIFVAIIVSRFDYHILEKVHGLLYIAAAVLMMLVLSPTLGVSSHGARRWLQIGPINFQPAEIAKIAVIVSLSCAIIAMGKKVRTLKGCMFLAGLGGLQAFIAYVFTDNLSTAIIIFGITVGMIFIAHPGFKWFIILAIVVIALAALVIMYLNSTMENSTNFRLQRILVWLHPENYADGDGYQTLQALYAIGSGGLLGRGLGNSIQKLGSVPEAQNDFIFSIICEELGIVGGVIVLLFFAYLLYRLFFIAQNAPDMFGSLLVSGIFIHISLQVILNIAVVLALLPNTGVTLPFISYGGTSVLLLMAEMGIALGVARKIELQAPALL